jgi:hypothetical protein
MAMTVKEITLWRRDIDNTPGTLANLLEPLAGTDLKVVMAYRHPGHERAAVELFPVSGKRATAKAEALGLSPAGVPSLLVEGPNRAGLGFHLTGALAAAGVNLAFLVTQVVGSRFSSVIGFDTEADRAKARSLLKQTPKRKR